MTTITIPKELSKSKDLIAVPRNAYADFLSWQKQMKSIRTFKPTKEELKAIARGRKDIARGDYVTLEKLENELDRNH